MLSIRFVGFRKTTHRFSFQTGTHITARQRPAGSVAVIQNKLQLILVQTEIFQRECFRFGRFQAHQEEQLLQFVSFELPFIFEGVALLHLFLLLPTAFVDKQEQIVFVHRNNKTIVFRIVQLRYGIGNLFDRFFIGNFLACEMHRPSDTPVLVREHGLDALNDFFLRYITENFEMIRFALRIVHTVEERCRR